MHITFRRSQSSATFSLVPLRVGGGVKFALHAKADLSAEEPHLLRRYRFENALLIADDPMMAVRSAIRTSTILIIPTSIVLVFVFGYLAGSMLSILGFFALTFFYYQQLREHIYVRDLTNGRTFNCFSVVELIQKEAYLEHIMSYLRQVLESAMHWDDKETIEILPLSKEDAKHFVLMSRLRV